MRMTVLAKSVLLPRCVHRRLAAAATALHEIGTLSQRLDPAYPYGPRQLFLHRTFHCRGIVLLRWLVDVHHRQAPVDRSQHSPQQDVYSLEDAILPAMRKVWYYQVFTEEEDWRQMAVAKPQGSNGCKQAVLGTLTEETSVLRTMPGLDYVSHDDILPYDRSEHSNHLYERFLHALGSVCSSIDQYPLGMWTEQQLRSLQLYSSVAKCSRTENIHITVIPFYIGRRHRRGMAPSYLWQLLLRFRNLAASNSPVTLSNRTWFIYEAGLQRVEHGVASPSRPLIMPRLDAQSPVFEYVQDVELESPMAEVWGDLAAENAQNSSSFRISIPQFTLDCRPKSRRQSDDLK